MKSETLKTRLQEIGYSTPLPSQAESYGVIKSGSDCVMNAHTGSGKTCAFLLPIIEMISSGSLGDGVHVKCIVVAPGRELCSQITDVAKELTKGMDVKVMMCIGGTGYDRTVERFRANRPDVIVGTPGRIAEMISGKGGKKGVVKTAKCGVVVMDEADNLLLSKAHKESMVECLETVKRGNKGVQIVMASATAGDMKEGVVGRWCREGWKEVGDGVGSRRGEEEEGEEGEEGGIRMIDNSRHISATTIHGVVKIARDHLKLELLRKILNTSPNPNQVLVFVNEARRVDIVVEKLSDMGIIAAGLKGGDRGDKDERVQVAKALRDGRVGCVVSTEIAARGIDAVFLTHVVNLDLPTDASHYCHRAGRVGRGGRPGVVVSMASGGKEKGVVGRWGKELGVKVADVAVREGMMRIIGVE
ncbi:hypothetical protein TrCOL_g12926 [Triparma columacea]|uniref:RNA helicase n=1 Tax=Triparma columacea TaxID=722753 RepID=A0A9W7LG25_9STRA|nr:hypothetical protein TrCOL_g12926 [Triparma columacea]